MKTTMEKAAHGLLPQHLHRRAAVQGALLTHLAAAMQSPVQRRWVSNSCSHLFYCLAHRLSSMAQWTVAYKAGRAFREEKVLRSFSCRDAGAGNSVSAQLLAAALP